MSTKEELLYRRPTLDEIYQPRVRSEKQPGEWEFPEQQIGEFETTLPTPTQAENDVLGTTAGAVVMRKQWDLSPVDLTSFDPTEPPGRPVAPVDPPTNTAPPVIAALTDLVVGSQLVNNSFGTWTGSPAFTRQWRRGNTNIPTATGNTYTLVAVDAGQNIICRVTGTNAAGAVTADSNALGPILPAAPINNTPPVVSGSTVEGGQLSTTNGAWSGAPAYDYLWLRGGTAITPSAVGQQYTTVAADVGATISCSVRGTNAGGQNAAVSNAVGPITITASDEPAPQPTRPQPRRRS